MSDLIPRGSLVLLTPDGPRLRGPDEADAPSRGLDRAVYDALCGLGLRNEMLTALVFVMEEDVAVVQMCRDLVRAEDIAALAEAYWVLPTWRQRTCLLHLVCDYADARLASIWSDILRAPVREQGDQRHWAKVIALWRLTGAHGSMHAFDDAELLRVAAGPLTRDLVAPLPMLREAG